MHEEHGSATERELAERFCCVKCRGRTALARTVSLGRGLPELLLGRGAADDHRYVLLSCALCGFTELYQCAICTAERESDQEMAAPAVLASAIH